MTTLIEITEALKSPFDPADIDFLPKTPFERDGKTFVAGMPFADPRVYQDRLNQICPGEWTTQASTTVAGNKLVILVTVTICGIPHTDVGEAFLTGMVRGKLEDEDNTATEAYAQAFKRACSQAGLGRFLYALDKQFLLYDKTKKRIDLTDDERKGKVRLMYQKAGLLLKETTRPTRAPETAQPQTQPQPQVQQQTREQARVSQPAQPQAQPRAIVRQAVPTEEPGPIGSATHEQRQSIAKLCKMLGEKKVALPANTLAAKELIATLAKEYKERRAAAG